MCFGYQSFLACVATFSPRNWGAALLQDGLKQFTASELQNKKTPTRNGLAFCLGYDRISRSMNQWNWFIVLSLPAAFSAASPLKYSLWSSPMSEPDMFWCLTQAMPWRISLRCTPAT